MFYRIILIFPLLPIFSSSSPSCFPAFPAPSLFLTDLRAWILVGQKGSFWREVFVGPFSDLRANEWVFDSSLTKFLQSHVRKVILCFEFLDSSVDGRRSGTFLLGGAVVIHQNPVMGSLIEKYCNGWRKFHCALFSFSIFSENKIPKLWEKEKEKSQEIFIWGKRNGFQETPSQPYPWNSRGFLFCLISKLAQGRWTFYR